MASVPATPRLAGPGMRATPAPAAASTLCCLAARFLTHTTTTTTTTAQQPLQPPPALCEHIPANEGGCDFRSLVSSITDFLLQDPVGTETEATRAVTRRYCTCHAAMQQLQHHPSIQVEATCPGSDADADDSGQLVNGSSFAAGTTAALALSERGVLATLIYVAEPGGVETPAACSYDGHPWEAYASNLPAAVDLEIDCGQESSCAVALPGLAGSSYVLSLYRTPPHSANETAALLLLQASFGPTRASLAEFFETVAAAEAAAAAEGGGRRRYLQADEATGEVRAVGHGAIEHWIGEQMRRPATLHRAYYRARARYGTVFLPCSH
eukprot:SAG22_NODE_14_length_33165_cov_13.196698_18_plen_325_part_00